MLDTLEKDPERFCLPLSSSLTLADRDSWACDGRPRSLTAFISFTFWIKRRDASGRKCAGLFITALEYLIFALVAQLLSVELCGCCVADKPWKSFVLVWFTHKIVFMSNVLSYLSKCEFDSHLLSFVRWLINIFFLSILKEKLLFFFFMRDDEMISRSAARGWRPVQMWSLW